MWFTFILAGSVAMQAPPSFSTGVDMVRLTVTAVDTGGEPVTDLTEDDFVVFEARAPREVTYFKQHDTSASVTLLVDASMSVKMLLPHLQAAARRFVTFLRPGDEVQALQFTTVCGILADFTTNHRQAADAIEILSSGDNTALYTALYTSLRSLAGRYPEQDERRRILILLTDGEDTSSSITGGMVLDEVRRSGVVVYAVHIRRDTTQVSGDIREILADQRQFMEQLAYESGGQIVDIRPPFDALLFRRIYEGIGQELGAQYQLGFVSRAADDDGWREIFVTSRSRSDVRLRYRRGYYAERRP